MSEVNMKEKMYMIFAAAVIALFIFIKIIFYCIIDFNLEVPFDVSFWSKLMWGIALGLLAIPVLSNIFLKAFSWIIRKLSFKN